MRNIALFIDGTSNLCHQGKGAWRNTNVVKLFQATSKLDAPGTQVSQYLCGVGSGGVDIPKTNHNGRVYRGLGSDYLPIEWIERIMGQAAGLGSLLRIEEAYGFLVNNYKSSEGDRIFLFGFSRGAFAARMLSDFVGKVGLLLKAHLSDVNVLFDLFIKGEDLSEFESRLYKLTDRRRINQEHPEEVLPIHFIGVWDAVAAIAGSTGSQKLHQRIIDNFGDEETDLPPHITHARHALALHELRDQFEPLLWGGYSGQQSLQQVWFTGAHSDVGGSYEEAFWSDIALEWMAGEAHAPNGSSGVLHKGLNLDWRMIPHAPNARSNFESPIHHQLYGIFFRNRFEPRSAILKRSLKKKAMFFVHQSVCERLLRSNCSRYDDVIAGTTQSLRKRMKSLSEKFISRAKEIGFSLISSHIPRALRAADKHALKMHLQLCYVHDRFPIDQATGTLAGASLAMLLDKWWSNVEMVDVAESQRIVDSITIPGQIPSATQLDKFSRSLCLQLLCGGTKNLTRFKSAMEPIIAETKRLLEIDRQGADAQKYLAAVIQIKTGMRNCGVMLPNVWRTTVDATRNDIYEEFDNWLKSVKNMR